MESERGRQEGSEEEGGEGGKRGRKGHSNKGKLFNCKLITHLVSE